MKKNKLWLYVLLTVFAAATVFNGCDFLNPIIDDWWIGPQTRAVKVVPITYYTIKFDMTSNGHYVDLRPSPLTAPPDQLVQEGYEAFEPGLVTYGNPHDTSKFFAGWYNIETPGAGPWNFSTPVTAAADPDGDRVITLQAKWIDNGEGGVAGVIVTFDTNLASTSEPANKLTYYSASNTSGAPFSEYLAAGSKVSEPKDFGLNSSAYHFVGWYTAATGGSQWNFNTNTVSANTTLYARWELESGGMVGNKQVYAIDFEDNLDPTDPNHGSIPTQYKLDGDTITKPNAIFKDGYIFSGWYTTSRFTGSPWDFANNRLGSSTPVSGTDTDDRKIVILYAKWEPVPYTQPWYDKYFFIATREGMQWFPFQCAVGNASYRPGGDTYEEDVLDLLRNHPNWIARITGYKDVVGDPDTLVTDRERQTWINLFEMGGIQPEQLIRNTKLPSGTESNPLMIIGPNGDYNVRNSAGNEVRIIIYIPM